MKTYKKFGLAMACAALMAGASFVVPASAQLLITPLQVTMEGRTRANDIVLVNTSQETNTYRLEWMQMELSQKTGGYQPSDMKSGKLFLQNFAVFSPRQVTLGPGEKQTVRIGVRRPPDLADGEYKSHLKFKVEAKPPPPAQKDPSLGKNEFRAGAQVQASFIVPVVYRSGEYDCKITLGDPSFNINEKTGKMIITVPVERAGIHGVIGLIEAYYKPEGGEETLLGGVGNANLFPEITSRSFKIPTQVSGLEAGTLRLKFLKAEGQKNNYVQLDEKTYPVGN